MKEKAEIRRIKRVARRNILLVNTFFMALVYWFDEGRSRDVTGMINFFVIT